MSISNSTNLTTACIPTQNQEIQNSQSSLVTETVSAVAQATITTSVQRDTKWTPEACARVRKAQMEYFGEYIQSAKSTTACDNLSG